MLNSRELRIILLLQEHDLSGEELATLLATSRRTIVRDIAQINTLLADEKIGSVESIKKYHLLVLNTANFNQLLTRVNNESDLVLLHLLIHPNISMAELAEKTFLSRQNILNNIEKLNRRFQNVLKISSKPRIGISLKIRHISKIDVLAALILDNQQLVTKQLKQWQLDPEIETPARIIRRQLPEQLFEYLTAGQLHAQILACYLIAQQAVTVTNPALLNEFVQHEINDSVASVLTNFFEAKLKLLTDLTMAKVQTAIQVTKTRYTLDALDNNFTGEILNHLRRSSMFSTFVPESLLEQIRYLKIQNPFAFDFAFDLTRKLQSTFKSSQIEDEYIALYVLRAIETPAAHNVRTLMYATRQSVANINKMIITEQVPNLDIEMVFSREQLETRLAYIDFDLVIGNGLNPNDLRLPAQFDSTFNGIISQDELDQLKNLGSESYIQENLLKFFPKSHFVRLKGVHHSAKRVLRDGLAKFSDLGLLTDEQATALINREEAGNQLVLNHISIPHASTELVDAYELFAISFDGEVKIAGKPIYLMIMVLANQGRKDNGQVFGYIYAKIRHLSAVQLQQLTDHEKLVDQLKQN